MPTATTRQTGFSDVSLSGTRNGSDFATTRVTTASMPPASQFGGLFFGDYSGLSAGDTAHPFWMDTRDPELFVCRDSAGNITLPPDVCTAGGTECGRRQRPERLHGLHIDPAAIAGNRGAAE